MHSLQVWLVELIRAHSPVAELMQTAWAWPIAESLHFIGLSLLVGTVGAFDLRLLGLGKRIPIAAMHRFIPWGVAGFVVNLLTGVCFVLTAPDQYIYNPSFHFKLLFLMLAGVNIALFYTTAFRRISSEPATYAAPPLAMLIAAVSLCAWIGVISSGRLLTFYRPIPCSAQPTELLLVCDPAALR